MIEGDGAGGGGGDGHDGHVVLWLFLVFLFLFEYLCGDVDLCHGSDVSGADGVVVLLVVSRLSLVLGVVDVRLQFEF